MNEEPETRIVKLGSDGKIILSFPDLADQYVIIKETDGEIIIQPYDFRFNNDLPTLLKIGNIIVSLDNSNEIPEV